ncbi:MAG: sodium:proton antiporter NhaD [Planctomycetes bacterium]|nr:sodium:proton antiporter NhaD [Planctomycetota bacterium]
MPPVTTLATTFADFTDSTAGLAALGTFVVAYLLVIGEDLLHLRKSKPVILAASVIWMLTALAYSGAGVEPDHVEERIKHHIADFAELFLFLLVAMTYISAIAQRNVFMKLNAMLVSAGFGFRAVYWTTGLLAFVISPIADNLTTALLMGAVVTAVGRGNKTFVGLSCINVVVAANAGGAFSPFGDITTLLVWKSGKIPFIDFFDLLVPSLVNWLVPAALMSFAIPKAKPLALTEDVELKDGWLKVIILFLLTITTAVLFHTVLHLPPFMGMMTGLGFYMLYGYARVVKARFFEHVRVFDVFENVAEVEWDTLLFFFGVIMCVGGLTELGYLAIASQYLYSDLGATTANVGVGLISAVLDNVPVMFAVLNMDPTMAPPEVLATGATELIDAHDVYQWQLVTLTAGVGGSLLSVGSAAGVALMGAARGQYTFLVHMRWMWAVALGYVGSIWVHHLMHAPAAGSAGS